MCHRDIFFRALESKEAAKLQAEYPEHIKPFLDITEDIGQRFPGLLENPHRVGNVDDTAIDVIYGKKIKVFTSASGPNGELKRCSTTCCSAQYIIEVFFVSYSGLKVSPFFIVIEKRTNKECFEAVKISTKNRTVTGGKCSRYCLSNWFPAETAVI